MDTSQEAYEAAVDRLRTAREILDKARDVLAGALNNLSEAEAELVRHEASPGIPLYSRTAAGAR